MHVKIILWKINSLISLWFFCINIYFSSIITGHFKIGQASPAFIRNGFHKNQKHYALHMPVVVNLMDKNPNTSACISGILIILNALQGEDYKLVTSKAQLLTARLTVKVLDNNTFSGSTNEFSKLFFVWFQFEVIHCSNNWLQKKCQSCFNKRQAPVVVEVVSDGIWHSQTWCWNLFLKIKHNNNIMYLWVWILLNHIYGIIYACIHIWHMHFQMKKLQPVARLMITSAALRTLQHVHLKKNNAKEDVEEWGGCKIIKKVGCLFCYSLEMGILAVWSGNLHK